MPNYEEIDRDPELLAFIFYPRRGADPCPSYASDVIIQAADEIFISCRFYSVDAGNPWILYFHGNGEIASDYDQIAPFYLQEKINLVVADYRGYGLSSGMPSLGSMLEDCHPIFTAVRKELSRQGYAGKLWIMGRSLGSLSALELAASHPDEINGIILESGFTSILPILRHLFLSPHTEQSLLEQISREASELVGRIFLPALVIHGDRDTLVPLQEGRNLYEGLGSSQKRFLIIPNSDHNTIIFTHPELYFGAISEFIQKMV
ncbi:MAG: Tropinesterase [Syntrophus sp. PtaU1.Bin208]|nr:MAG: Tropinesterase [Syntrophus sp. PtaU1.Bin208]